MNQEYHINAATVNNIPPLENVIEEKNSTLVFVGQTETNMDKLAYFASILCDFEKQRAKKFAFERDRNLYISSHGHLRIQLSKLLNLPPEQVKIEFEEGRKPTLKDKEQWDFNLSHSKDVFAFAVSRYVQNKLGIDIEKPRKGFEFDDIIHNYMHKDEINYIQNHSTDFYEKQQRFYEIWTRKEAFLKMVGIGIVANLPSINTSSASQTCNLDVPDYIHTNGTNCAVHSIRFSDYILSVAFNPDYPLKMQKL